MELVLSQKFFIKSLLIYLGFAWLSMVSAKSDFDDFPDVTFKVFSNFVQHHFTSDVSLATVLIVLFSLTSNPDLLGLHARQQHPKVEGEIKQPLSGWIKVLSQALQNRLGEKVVDTLVLAKEYGSESLTDILAVKLDGLSKILNLDPYGQLGILERKLKPIDEKDIAPVLVICPASMECETLHCQSRAIHKFTQDRDLSYANLIRGAGRCDKALVVAGQCTNCKTIYHADHEHSVHEGQELKLYLNSVSYLKVGKNVWVDRTFSNMVINGMYNFHASTSAFAEFWNMSFKLPQILSRRHIWQAFMQESIRRIAKVSGGDLELPNNLDIDEVAQQAFARLGEKGVIRCADGHTCEECTHDYKATADIIDDNEDPAAMVGMDEHQKVPAFVGEMEIIDDENSNDRMDVDDSLDISQTQATKAPVQMIVLDGIVMGPKHCAIEDCTSDLVNYQTGVYCQQHEELYGEMCHMINCENPKLENTLTCVQHQTQWNSHVTRFGRSNLLGVQRLLRRSETEGLSWVKASDHIAQPHDQPTPEKSSQVKYHFTAPRFYCVETICAPCGVVIAWTKFAKAESPTNILDFLDSVYPDKTIRPDYVCIDKACLLLRHAVQSKRWNEWKDTTRFIVDSYHYINHRTEDYLCRKYCNPAPLNGSAPNLVEVVKDKKGQSHYKRAFNTQACEQLNACLGGFESILKRMSAGNFNWFLHTMLFIHTERVIEKQVKKKAKEKAKEKEVESDDESD